MRLRTRARTPGKGVRKGPGEPGRKAPPDRKPPVEMGEEAHLPWGRKNYLILAAGGVVIVVGFILLALGDKTLAPILLVGGYLGLIPWGILASDRKGAADNHQNKTGE